MKWQADGYILSVRPHGETSAIVNILTREHGRHAGLVRGGRSKRMRPVLQAGNQVNASWSARLSEHLGVYAIEIKQSNAANIMQDKQALIMLNALCSLAITALPERQQCAELYDVFDVLIANLDNPDLAPALYVRFELALLSALGYGLDFASCVATGVQENLTHISPKSGRAVSRDAAAPYLDKLLKIPGFLQGDTHVKSGDIQLGLEISGLFLERRVFHSQNKPMPEARERLAELFCKSELGG